MQSKKRGGRITIRLTEKDECKRECENIKPRPATHPNLVNRGAWVRYLDCYSDCEIQYPNRNRRQRRGGRRATRKKNRRTYF